MKVEIGVATVHAFGELLQTNIGVDQVKAMQASLLPLYYAKGSKVKTLPLENLSRILAATRSMMLVGVVLTHQLVAAVDQLCGFRSPSNIKHAGLGFVLQFVRQENERGYHEPIC